MDYAVETESDLDYVSDTSAATVENMVKILDALGHEDAFSIFNYVKDGMISSKIAIQDLGLTQKRFYSRLKDLLDVGLVEKIEGEYKFTTLGRIFSKISDLLVDIIDNKDQFELLEKLKDNSNLTSSEFKKIISMVSKSSADTPKLLTSIFFYEEQESIEIFSSYDNLVEKIGDIILHADKSVILATTHFDVNVIEPMMKSSSKNIKSRIIVSKEHLQDKTSRLKLLLTPQIVESVFESVNEPGLHEIKAGNVPNNFVIIDEKHCFFELPRFEKDNFTIGIYVIDEEIGARFMKLFSEDWEAADPIIV